ncbi:PREDICTED: 3'-N-debenzoyl-2'-deoxytaxol N-benzoyltransferase-like [Nelumbo nucifera]|uniref:3'-N-debenzoyl-2'-deoxytaxol N-benzoyltransferase-like n=2 Tax=Nelumbo nucifera TaxID=4432 RepID=A0A822ZCN0_NELNU|nr:PREDICTED: 3'-N-debenzoyl-2'-deoxytaxol N-benzoyltransferase-like [Nelumbo nucifera]DAD41249.1 TPA_asm: hypothetical protein HUJ06_015572 [Nelumbo nucifera]
MAFSIVVSAEGMVQPCEQTPSDMLHLSVIDTLPSLQFNVGTVHVFRHGPPDEEAAKVIKEALAKALVPYYPLAGRIKESTQGGQAQVQVACTGEGVWFVQASAHCTLLDVNYVDGDGEPLIPHQDFLPHYPPITLGFDPVVLIKVTQFKCNGFIVGLITHHCVADGLGAAQFLNAVGELARGMQQPSIAPLWCREAIPTPPRLAYSAGDRKLPKLPAFELETGCVDISLDRINQIKQQHLQLTGRTCSTFEIVVASLWICRTRAINFVVDTEVKLMFFANGRRLLNPPLPEGFYGNCVYPLAIKASSGAISRASLSEVVTLLQKAKKRSRKDFSQWIDSGLPDPFAPYIYSNLFISEWNRLGFNQVDYGWGPPLRMIPTQGPKFPVALILALPKPNTGIRLITWSLEGTHLPYFMDEMMKIYHPF